MDWHNSATPTFTIPKANSAAMPFIKQFITNQIQVFPNPNSGDFVVNMPLNYKDGILQITDVAGKNILKQNIINTNNLQIKLSNCNTGIYFITISKNNFVAHAKFIKQ